MKNVKARLKKSAKGSFSIEAAFVVPILLSIILLLIYLAFFLYNHNMLQQGLFRKAFLKANAISEDKEKEKTVLKKEEFLSIKELEVKEESTKEYIIMYGAFRMHIPAENFLTKFLTPKQWSAYDRKSANILKPVSFIRGCRKIEKLAKENNP